VQLPQLNEPPLDQRYRRAVLAFTDLDFEPPTETCLECGALVEFRPYSRKLDCDACGAVRILSLAEALVLLEGQGLALFGPPLPSELVDVRVRTLGTGGGFAFRWRSLRACWRSAWLLCRGTGSLFPLRCMIAVFLRRAFDD
jgi:hypothetical protein